MKQIIKRAVLSVIVSAVTTGIAMAQIGSGWTRKSYGEDLHYHHTGGPVIEKKSPPPPSFSDNYVSYQKSGDVRTFVFKNTTAGRCEILVKNYYTSGQRQFEGYLTFFRPSSRLSDYGGTYVMQIFGAATHAAWKLRVHSDGSFRAAPQKDPNVRGPLLASGAYGQTYRVNVIHNKNNRTIQVYINGSKKLDGPDEGGTKHYFKFGMYGGHFVGRATWRGVKFFTK